MHSKSAEWERTYRQLVEQARDLKPHVRLRPRTIAREAAIPAWQALAILRLLEEAHLGEIRLKLGDPRRGGLELRTFRRIEDVPKVFPDSLGDLFEVAPEDVEVVFVPRSALDREANSTREAYVGN